MSDDIQLGLRISYDGASAQAGVAQFRKGIDDLSSSLDKSADEAQKVMDKYDPMGVKLRALKEDLNALSTAARNGQIAPGDDAKLDQVYARIQAEIKATQGALSDFGAASASSFKGMAEGADKGAFATAGARRELIVLGHEAMTGNFSRMPGSFMVLAERASFSTAAFGLLGGALAASAVAVVGAVVAYQQGAAEMAAMNNAIASTAGYAGLTRDGMVALAQSVEQSGHVTIGVAKDLVTTLVSSGRIGADAIGVVAGLAEGYAKATGKSVEEIGPELVKLFDDPAKGAEELNRSMHFLTAGQLEYIASLQRQGETGQAQLVLGNALKDNLEEQSKKLTALGETLNSAKKFWSDMWDAAKGIGAQDAIEKQIQVAKTALLKAQAGVFGGGNVAEKQAAYDALLAQQDAANQRALERQRIADDNELQMRAASAIAANSKLAQIQALEDQRKLVERRTIEGKTQDELDAAENRKAEAIREIDKKIRDTRDSMSAEGRATQRANITADIALAKETSTLEIAAIRDRVAEGNMTEEQGILAIRDAKTAALVKEYQDQQQLLATTRSNAAERIAIQQQMVATVYAISQAGANAARELATKERADEKKLAQEKNKELADWFKQEEKAQQLVSDFIKKTRKEDDRVSREAEMIGMREKDIAVLQEQMKLEDDADQARAKAYQDIKDPQLYADAIAAINDRLEKQKVVIADTTRRVFEYATAWGTGVKKAVNSYLDAADNMAQQTEHLTTDVFQGVEDSLVSLVTKGKADFKSLADSILADLARMAVKKGEAWVINWAVDLFANSGSGSGGSGGSSSGGNGSGAGSTAGTLVSTGTGVYQLYQGVTSGTGTGMWGQAGNYIGKQFGTSSAPATDGVTVTPVTDYSAGMTTLDGTSAALGEGSNAAYAAAPTTDTASMGAGWASIILLAFDLVAQYQLSHTGGAKTEGDAFLTATSDGVKRSDTGTDGKDIYAGGAENRTLYTGNGMNFIADNSSGLNPPATTTTALGSRNDAVANLLTGFISNATSFISSIGGKVTGDSFALGFSQDPSGAADDQVVGKVSDALGNILYDSVRNVSRGQAGKEMNVELSKMMLATISGSGVADVYKHIIGDTANIKNLTADQVTAAMSAISSVASAMQLLTGNFKDAVNSFKGTATDIGGFAAAMHDLQSALSADPFGDYAKSAELANSVTLQLSNSTDALTGAAKAYNGTLSGAQQLATLATSRYQTELALAKQLDSVLQATTQQFAQGRETIATSGLDAAGKYNYYDRSASMNMDLLRVATTPEMIQQYSTGAFNATMAAWGTLDATQQAAERQAFQDKLNAEESATKDRAAAIQDQNKAANDDLRKTVGEIVADAVSKISAAAAMPQAVAVTATVNVVGNGQSVSQVGGWAPNMNAGTG